MRARNARSDRSPRLPPRDAILWKTRVDPQLDALIVSVALLDRPVPREEVVRLAERAAEILPHLCDEIRGGDRLGRPVWRRSGHAPADRVRVVDAPPASMLEDALALAASGATVAFGTGEPQWALTVFQPLADGGAALILKRHHVLVDGVGMARLLRRLLVGEPDPAGPAAEGEGGAGPGAVRRTRPQSAAALRFRTIRARASALTARPRPSATLPGRSQERRYEIVPVPLEALRAAGRAVGATINDVFLAAVAAGAALYHERCSTAAASVRVAVPINLRPRASSDLGGNQFAMLRTELPLEPRGATERIRLTGEALARARGRLVPDAPAGLAEEVLARAPAPLVARLLGRVLKGVDIGTTNVTCSPRPQAIGDAVVTGYYAFIPLSGAAAGVALCSYAGTAHVAIGIDPAAVRDPDLFTDCIRSGLDLVLAAG